MKYQGEIQLLKILPGAQPFATQFQTIGAQYRPMSNVGMKILFYNIWANDIVSEIQFGNYMAARKMITGE